MSKAPRRPVLVIGDFMLDVYIGGSASRLSPEAPVPVIRESTRRSLPGGAANTAANIVSLGEEVIAVGFVGEDEAARELGSALQSAGVDFQPVKLTDYQTIVKTRFLANGHQIMRLDSEIEAPDRGQDILWKQIRELIPTCAAIVLSDYDKGVIGREVATRLIAIANETGIPVIVDSKKKSPECFHGCTIIAPNHGEAFAMTGKLDPLEAAEVIYETTNSSVLITLGDKGMLLLENGRTTAIPSEAQEVTDVTGAGDTVTAALAVALVNGSTLDQSIRYANRAAAITVSHLGTYTVKKHEVWLE
jgi:rfaE bifunctional protein kinase chain/domain